LVVIVGVDIDVIMFFVCAAVVVLGGVGVFGTHSRPSQCSPDGHVVVEIAYGNRVDVLLTGETCINPKDATSKSSADMAKCRLTCFISNHFSNATVAAEGREAFTG
jgi:hypothetical protein